MRNLFEGSYLGVFKLFEASNDVLGLALFYRSVLLFLVWHGF